MKYLISLIVILFLFSCVKKKKTYTKTIFVVYSIANVIDGCEGHPGMVYYKIVVYNNDNELPNRHFYIYDEIGIHNINDTISFTKNLKSNSTENLK